MKRIHLCTGSRAASLALVAALSACSTMRGSSHHPPPESPPTASVENPTPPPQASEPATPETSNENAQQAGSNAAIPVCVPPETKAKPKIKPKPKPVRKEAPPQLPTAPTVAETPPGGVVDAQVRPMPVSVMSILGKRVQGAKGEDLGRVVDVLADASGRVRIAIIDFGGFLGVGDRRIAVDWPLLRFNPDKQDPSLLLSLSRDKLKAAPEYKDNPRPQTLMEPAAPAAAASPAAAPAAEAPTPPENKK
ncbi:MAG: photosystem reaction center protein [Gammaproteobacteria bacterium]|nr:photosystem reaction center protein [Gammaproteobacteria bacterium]